LSHRGWLLVRGLLPAGAECTIRSLRWPAETSHRQRRAARDRIPGVRSGRLRPSQAACGNHRCAPLLPGPPALAVSV